MNSTGWKARADAELLANMPGRRRIVVEILFVVTLVLGGHVYMRSLWLGVTFVAIEFVIAIGLLRPWAMQRRLASRALVALVALSTVLIPLLVQGPQGSKRRLGVELAPVTSEPPAPTKDTVRETSAEVTHVTPGTPADGALHTGDRIVAVDDVPLTGSDPPAELARRIQSESLPENTRITVQRDGAPLTVSVYIPRAPSIARQLGVLNSLAEDHLIVATALRDLVFTVFLLLLVRADGQSFAALGITRKDAAQELEVAVPAIGGIFIVQLATAVPIALLSKLTHLGQHEATARIDTLSHLSGQTSIPEFLVSLFVAASFEEVAFRAFLTPRVRTLSGSWITATAIVSVLFGLGHGYEGTLAIVQITMLGVYFTGVFLVRRRLLGVAVAHATFNAAMFVLVRIITQSGAFERLKALAPH